MRIAYITTYDARPDAQSVALMGVQGAGQSIAQELTKKGFELDFIGPLSSKVSLLSRAWRFLEKRLHGTDWPAWLCTSFRKGLAREIRPLLNANKYDAVLSPQNFWPISYLEFSGPVVLWTDAPFGLQFDAIGKLRESVKRTALAVERRAFVKCSTVVVASNWAKLETERLFNLGQGKVVEVNWGGNAGGIDKSELPELVQLRQTNDTLKLLFVGIDWRRKGLPIAISLAKELNAAIPAELHVVGPTRNELDITLPDFVKLHGRLSPSTPDERERLCELYKASHVFVLPSRWENFGQVLCEANSYGLPCLASSVGGIPSIVKNGLNGYTVEPSAPIASWKEACLLIKERYQQMAVSAHTEYCTRLSWQAAVGKLCDLLGWT